MKLTIVYVLTLLVFIRCASKNAGKDLSAEPTVINASVPTSNVQAGVIVVNGNSNIPADTGFVEVTKNDGKMFSGYVEAHATNENKDVFRFRGQYLNVKPR